MVNDISNRTLSLFLMAAIVVSIGGSFMVLTTVSDGSNGITGFATNNQTGEVNLTVEESMSIAVRDSSIDIGKCTINTSQMYSFISSDSAAAAYDNDDCDKSALWTAAGDYLVLENDGNKDLLIEISTDYNSTDFFIDPDTKSWYKYWLTNETGREGCVGTMTTDATMFTTTGFANRVSACSNLTAMDSNDRIRLYIQANISSATTGTQNGGSFELKFTGSAAV